MLIGATALSEAAFTLEKTFTAGTNDEKALELLKERLDEVLSLLLPGAEAQKAAIGKVSNTGTDVDKAHALIRRLEPLLEDGSSEATDLADEIKEAFSQELCGELVALLLDYEFDTALKELHKIKQQLENN
jgi:HPt (histidine-containing phosphotransfer) domain-containing protein